ncbi:endo-1,4-beta-xylanase [Asticcacaulis solisilvae]|uniref:endo-1,4-beta-xylanase n=1 Tax=Asticcacaulis solisilvae TaxID=1217274 RepID=UPI003FD894CE
MIHSKNDLTRRSALSLMAAGAAAAALPAFADSPSLADLARAKGLRFGTAVPAGKGGVSDPDVAALIARECNIIVPENELKMYVTHNNNAKDYNFGPGDQILAFAKAHNIAMRGHNLFWARDEFTPQWLKSYDFGPNPKVAAEKLLRDYIATVADHYGTALTSWDVVNETIDPQTGKVRENAFSRVLGMDALRIAYEATREHLPHMQLVYNDYMGWETGGEVHRNGVITLLHWFRDNKVPVDALGLQSHLGTDHDVTLGNVKAWTDFLNTATGLGFDLLVTEFDVNDRHVQGTIAERDAVVAKIGREYLDLCLSYKQTKDVLAWGITDRYNWLQGFTPRDDKQPLRPAPFDADFKPKPLTAAIADAFKAASPR